MTARDIEKEITELTCEGSAYWDKTHINHQKSVDEVLSQYTEPSCVVL